jgi:ribose transport system substrate-binding protein
MGVSAVKALNTLVVDGKTVDKTIQVPATIVTKANVDTFRPMFKQ